MGELVLMPKRTRRPHRNPETGSAADAPDQGAVEAPAAPPKKKKRKLGWLKWGAVTVGSAILGGVAWRKWDDTFGRGREAEAPPQPQQPMIAGFGGMPMATMVPMPMYPQAPPAPAVPSELRPSEMTVGELEVLLKRKKAAEKARRSRLVDQEFWEE
jgi:hypothetical protein